MNSGLGERCIATAAVITLIFGIHAQSQTKLSLDWPVYGGQAAAGPLLQPLIRSTRKNVQELKLAWKFDAHEEGGLETSPIIVGRILYAYTATQKVVALDAASGKLIWKFDPGIEGKNPVRGLSYWTDGKAGQNFRSGDEFSLRPRRSNRQAHSGLRRKRKN